MIRVADRAVSQVRSLLTSQDALNANLASLSQAAGLALAPLSDKQILSQNVAFELVERALEMKYPTVHIYCEKVANLLIEKFRTFSGKVHMTVEVRLSQDRLEGLEGKLQLYVEAITGILDRHRGDWGQGMFYGGAYEAVFAPVKHGGQHFIQIAKILFEVGVSQN